jgi:hypothetical protein
VASAIALHALILSTPTKRFIDIEDLMVPISCLFCCPDECLRAQAVRTKGPLAVQVADRVTRFWGADREATERPVVHETGPVYVERMFKGENAETGWQGFPRFVARDMIRQRELPKGISRAVLVRDIGLS